MERLLDPKNDWAFKQVFGQEKNKAILIHFLNDMLDEHVLHGDRITNVRFLRVDLDTEIALLRQSIVDVLCKTKNGTHFIIEMQKASDSGFINRAVEYASRVYLNQRTKTSKIKNDKGGYKKLMPVIFLAVIDDTLFPKKKAFLSHHQLRDIITGEHDMKQMSFSFFELSKFHKKFDQLETNIDKWAYFFKNAEHIDPKELKSILEDGEIFGDAYKVLESSAYTPEELLEYYRYQQKEEEIQTRIHDAHKSGLKKGKEEGEKIGIEKGEKNAKVEAAKNFLAMGLSIEQVAKGTGLSVKDIEKLCK